MECCLERYTNVIFHSCAASSLSTYYYAMCILISDANVIAGAKCFDILSKVVYFIAV